MFVKRRKFRQSPEKTLLWAVNVYFYNDNTNFTIFHHLFDYIMPLTKYDYFITPIQDN